MVMENMFGDILSDLASGLVGWMGMAACGKIVDQIGLFQPAHGSAPDIMGQDIANPLAEILSAQLMEIGGDIGTKAITLTLSSLTDGKLK
jgi:3-isopropylmalate dehydrogenase